MNLRRIVWILIGIMLISFGVGFFSLIYNDQFRISDYYSGQIFSIRSNGSKVNIGNNGINIIDGDSRVRVGWDGIEVIDGEDQVIVGWGGINIKEGNKSKFSIGNPGEWISINEKMVLSTVNEEKFHDISNINSLNIHSDFVDVKLIAEDREDIRIRYYGQMKSNVTPTLEIEEKSRELFIKLETKGKNYAVQNSDVVLEIYVPLIFIDDYSLSTASGDVFLMNLIGDNIAINSSSGDIRLVSIEANNININTASGDMEIERPFGDFKIASSSGDIDFLFMDNPNYSVKGSTLSGDIRSNFPISVEKDKVGRFELSLGTGENTIEITSSSGDIKFTLK